MKANVSVRAMELDETGSSAWLSYPADTFRRVPRISAFYGIAIYLYTREHGVAHFHAFYGEHEAVIAIATGEVVQGGLPRRQAALVTRWHELHRDELERAWAAASAGEPTGRIEPLP